MVNTGKEQRQPDQPGQAPFVSICVPAYNAAGTLGQTLDSLLAQRYSNFEIIVSDNHSTDATPQVIQSYAARGVRYCQPDTAPDWLVGKPSYIGAYVNANFVSKRGTGEFLCLYHADDLYHPDMVARQAALMEANPHVGAVFTALRTIGPDGQPIRMGEWLMPGPLQGRQVFDFASVFNAILVYGNFLYTPSVMLRRSVLDAVGDFDEERFRTSADLEMFLRIAQRFSIGIINEPLLNYRISPKQYSAQYNRLRTTPADFFTVIDHFLAQPAVQSLATPEAMASYLFQRSKDQIDCATNMLLQGRVDEAAALLRSATQKEHFATAVRRRSKRLAYLFFGVGLLASSRIGLGPQAARLLHEAEQLRMQRRQSASSSQVQPLAGAARRSSDPV